MSAARVDAAAHALARELAEAGGPASRAVLVYGSHLLGMAGEHSALDLVVVVRAYRPFYAALKGAGEIHRPVWVMTAGAHVLPPNVIAFAPRGGTDGIAKALVVSEAHLARALGPGPKDFFLLGRLIQRVDILWSADAEARAWTEARIDKALAGVLSWAAPYVEGAFDAERLGRRLLEVLYGGELRPEAEDRAESVFEAQREHFRERLTPVLERAAADGTLVPDGTGAYRLARAPTAGARLRVRARFARSKARATLRWLKHVVTFDNWLPYVVRKVERHTGTTIELTRLERRWPLIFLWPRAIKVLVSRPTGERSS